MTTNGSTDEQYEDRLLRALLEDFNELTASSTPAARPAPRKTRIRRTAPALVAGAAGVAAVAVVAVVAASLPSHGGAASHPRAAGHASQAVHHPAVTQPRLRTASFVLAKITAATEAGPFVVAETGHAPDSQTGATVYTKSWFEPGGSTSRDEVDDAAGNPASATVMTSNPDGSTHVVSIDYSAKTWSEKTYGPAAPGGPAPLPQTPAQNADRLRSAQAHGKATLLGPATIDGQQTIELQQGSVAKGEQLTWVNADTYLPVRELDLAPGESASSDAAIQTDDQWLPATSENLRLVTAAAAIPPGFTKQR